MDMRHTDAMTVQKRSPGVFSNTQANISARGVPTLGSMPSMDLRGSLRSGTRYSALPSPSGLSSLEIRKDERNIRKLKSALQHHRKRPKRRPKFVNHRKRNGLYGSLIHYPKMRARTSHMRRRKSHILKHKSPVHPVRLEYYYSEKNRYFRPNTVGRFDAK